MSRSLPRGPGAPLLPPRVPTRPRLRVAVAGLLFLAVLSLLLFGLLRLEVLPYPGGYALVQSLDLHELYWDKAETDWLAVAGDGRPKHNANFAGQPMSIRGKVYERGIGTYPLAEIVYRLEGQYRLFESEVGVDDAVPAGQGQSRFLVYGDGVKLFDSGVLRGGERPKLVRVSVDGLQELRLVTVDETPDGRPGYANWANPRLRRSLLSLPPQPPVAAALAVQQSTRKASQERERQRLAAAARTEFQALSPLLAAAQEDGSGVLAFHDAARDLYVLANDRLVLTLGYGGDRHGYLTVLDRRGESLLLHSTASSLALDDGPTYNLARDTTPASGDREPFESITDPVFGRGRALALDVRILRAGLTLRLHLSLYQDSPYFLYRLSVLDPPSHITAATFNYFDYRFSNVVLGEAFHYLTDYGRLRHITVADDGLEHRERVGEGKPVFLWSRNPVRSLLLAVLEEATAPTRLKVQLPPGRQEARVEFSGGSSGTVPGLQSPRLYVEFSNTTSALQAFSNFRQAITALYPPPPLPSWVRYQWNSWYTYYMEITEDELKRQIDYIDENLSDLGPWHIAIDAGWYVAEGREGSDWRAVDDAKFPSGLRSLVDYAHERGVRVILYFSAPYLDNREVTGNWLGLRQIVEEHPEWLIKVDSDERGEGYVYDFTHPGFLSYLHSVLRDYFVTYDVDGIEVDGLGTVGPALQHPDIRDGFGIVSSAVDQTLAIYRLVYENARAWRRDPYIFGGWHAPLFANPYSHAFWYSDELPVFTNHYPYSGLVEHVDYAIAQQWLWGQPSHMGFAYGNPNRDAVPGWWLEASLALGAQVSLGFDLPSMTLETLSWYRERLLHYRPFRGERSFAGPYPPDVFGSHRDGITYVGVLNRSAAAREVPVKLEELGLEPWETYLVRDVEAGRYFLGAGAFTASMAPQSFRLFLVRKEPGLVWSNSSVRVVAGEREVRAVISGPEAIEGFLDLYIPSLSAVYLDGRRLAVAGLEDVEEPEASYDPETQVLHLTYPHDRWHLVRVVWE